MEEIRLDAYINSPMGLNNSFFEWTVDHTQLFFSCEILLSSLPFASANSCVDLCGFSQDSPPLLAFEDDNEKCFHYHI